MTPDEAKSFEELKAAVLKFVEQIKRQQKQIDEIVDLVGKIASKLN